MADIKTVNGRGPDWTGNVGVRQPNLPDLSGDADQVLHGNGSWSKTLNSPVLTTPTMTAPVASGDLSGFGGAWTVWTPTWTGLTVGNGVLDAKYVQVGKTVHFSLSLTFGSTTVVSGNVSLTRPVAKRAGSVPIFHAEYADTGTGLCIGFADLTTNISLYAINFSTGYHVSVSTSFPFTWTAGDILLLSGTYEAA